MTGRRIPAAVTLFALFFLVVSAHAQNLLILPFENLGKDARLDWIGEGLAELSAERISGDGRLVFPREEWLSAMEKMGLPASGHFSRATMIKIGEEVDADYIVFGSFTSDGKTLTATARVLQVDLSQDIEGPVNTTVIHEDNLVELPQKIAGSADSFV